jgi:hypothetical protein
VREAKELDLPWGGGTGKNLSCGGMGNTADSVLPEYIHFTNRLVTAGAALTPIITNTAMMRVSIPALILISFITNAAARSVSTQKARAPQIPNPANTQTISMTSGMAAMLPSKAVYIRETWECFAMTWTIQAILGQIINKASPILETNSSFGIIYTSFLFTSRFTKRRDGARPSKV